MAILRYSIGSLVFVLSAGLALADGISVSQSLDESDIAFTDSAKFEIVLEWEGPQMAYSFDSPLNLNLTGLKIRRFSSSIGSSTQGGKEITTKRFHYVLEPISGGPASIEPVDISYINWPDSIPGRLLTEAVAISVTAPKIVEKSKPSSWLGLPVVGFIVAMVVIVIVLAIGKRSKRPVSKTKTWREDLLDELDDARVAAGADLKRFQTEVYKILVAFLLQHYNINAMTLSRETLLERLVEAGMPSGKAGELCGRLFKAQKDKYSPWAGGPGETVRLESELREFFEKL